MRGIFLLKLGCSGRLFYIQKRSRRCESLSNFRNPFILFLLHPMCELCKPSDHRVTRVAIEFIPLTYKKQNDIAKPLPRPPRLSFKCIEARHIWGIIKKYSQKSPSKSVKECPPQQATGPFSLVCLPFEIYFQSPYGSAQNFHSFTVPSSLPVA